MNDRDTYRDTLVYALAIAGSERELAEQLGVTLPQARRWLSGANEVPHRIFLATLDVITTSSRQAIWRSRERLQQMAR